MRPSRGMGAIMPDKMPKGKKIARKDSTDFTQFKEGGTVNKAGKAKGKQFVAQPKSIKQKVKPFRKI